MHAIHLRDTRPTCLPMRNAEVGQDHGVCADQPVATVTSLARNVQRGVLGTTGPLPPLPASAHCPVAMYSTCLYCHASLGRNLVVESFPVGRRLAFDPARARLWVICRSCDSWNLSPLEQRWEAVEECERAYRATPIRVSTDNIGLATVSPTLDLVRVGKPLRPEFAAWRYGARMRRHRLQRAVSATSVAITTGTAMAFGTVAALAGLAAMATGSRGIRVGLQYPLEQIEARLSYDRVLAHVRTPDGTLRPLRFSHIVRMEIVATHDRQPWSFRIAHQDGITELDGPNAGQVAGQLLSRLNPRGGTPGELRHATRLITDAGDPEQYIRASGILRYTRRRKNSIFWDDSVGVLGLTATERLALEIAMHEDTERQAMQGELAALEMAWRDAEEIAAISDALVN